MIKHVFNEVLVWDAITEMAVEQTLCENCGRREGLDIECTLITAPGHFYDLKYLKKALKALTKEF